MKCPLFAHENYDKEDYPMQLHEDCIKYECAWWDGPFEACCVPTLTRAIVALGGVVDGIKHKIPRDK